MIEPLIYWLDLAGTAIFASSGAVMAARLRMDPFGMIVLASLPAVGGGTLRDLILGVRPVFWVADPNYVLVIVATTLACMLLLNHISRIPERLMLVLDALGLALFCMIGARKALLFQPSWTIAVIMGVMTGVAGGMMRDIVCRQIPLILRKEVYATACIAGCSCYILLAHYWHLDDALAMAIGMAVTALVRLAAIIWQLQLPAFHLQPQRRQR